MPIRVAIATMLSVLLAGAAHAQVLPIPRGWQMERTVLLSRHGVRSPDMSNAELDRYVASPWPVWPVQPGYLTPRGAELMKLMGSFYRVMFGGLGLVETDDCPPDGAVSAWTDTDPSSRLTGASILGGMYPRCGSLSLHHLAGSQPDPLFHPSPSSSCPMDAESSRRAVLARVGGDFAIVQREYAAQLSSLQAILCPSGLTPGNRCGLPAGTSSIETRPDGAIRITGPIGLGSRMVETFLMEEAEGLPSDQVAWGRLSGEAQLRDLLKLRRLDIDLTDKTLPVARQRGSGLLSQINTTLQNGHDFPGQPATAQPVRFALLVGHDANIANVARLLNIGWQIAGYQPNEIAPGGALAFELLRDVPTGRRYVRLAYYAQTLTQMRDMTRLNALQPSGMVAVSLPACEGDLQQRSCPLERFVDIVAKAIEPGCVAAKP